MPRTDTNSLRTRIETSEEDYQEKDGVVYRPDGLRFLAPVRAAAFLGLVRAGATLSNQLNTELEREHGIGLRAFEILLFLAVFSDDGSLSMAELAKEAPLSQSRISRLVSDLDNRGLVERFQSETDGRGVTVTITPAGIAKFKAAQETHLAGLERHFFTHLNQAEIRHLAAATRKILKASGGTPDM